MVIALLGITLSAQLRRVAEPDLAFLLYGAGRVLDGGKLYRDIVEINPPLIIWLNLPIARLARAAGASDILLGRLATALVLGCILLFVRALLTRYLLVDRAPVRRYVLLAICFILFPLSREDFGEREQLVLALLLPWIVVAVARWRREQITSADAVASGLLAGLGLAIKPHFVLAWLGVELWGRLRDRPGRWRLSPDLGAVLGTLIAYAVAVATVTPDYLHLAVELGPAYTTYLRIPLLNLFLFSPGSTLTLFALVAAVAVRNKPGGEARTVIAVAMIGCFLAGVAQQKGLRYHFYPSFALAALLLALVAGLPARPLGLGERLYVRVSRWLVAALGAVVLASNLVDAAGGGPAARRRRAEFRDLVETVQRHAGRESIAVLSYYMGSAFPLVNYAEVGLASRFPHLWIFPASYWTVLWEEQPIRYHTWSEMQFAERMLNDAMAQDLLRGQPRLLLILRPFPDQARYGLRRLNYVAYFGRRPELASLFAEYQLIATKGQYDIYQRLKPGETRTGIPPSPLVPPLEPIPSAALAAAPPLVDPELVAGILVFEAIGLTSLLLQWRGNTRSITR